MLDNESRFKELFQTNIKRDGADKLLMWLSASDFFEAPASTRFHSAYKGGLLQHSLNVYDCLVAEVKASGLEERYGPETVAITALLHDVCKVNFYKPGFRNVKDDATGKWYKKETFEIDEVFPCGHGEKSVIIIQNFMRLTIDEIYAIRAHMGGFDTSVKGGAYFIGDIFEKSALALLLHIADLKATYILEGK